jgi:hypothetical protein
MDTNIIAITSVLLAFALTTAYAIGAVSCHANVHSSVVVVVLGILRVPGLALNPYRQSTSCGAEL